MKLLNPLAYPLPVLVGCLVLVLGARLGQLPSRILWPVAGGVAVAGGLLRQRQENDPERLALQELEAEVQGVKAAAVQLAQQAEVLRQEADQVLHSRELSMELLTAVQYGCDLAIALPGKVERLGAQLSQGNSLLSTEELERRLARVRSELASSQGAKRTALQKLAQSLERNIQLTQAGSDTRQTQLLELATLIQDSAGTLQQLQNSLRSINLDDSTQVSQLQDLSEDLSQLQRQTDLLM
jgi:chromosome segregation ATPase